MVVALDDPVTLLTTLSVSVVTDDIERDLAYYKKFQDSLKQAGSWRCSRAEDLWAEARAKRSKGDGPKGKGPSLGPDATKQAQENTLNR